MTVLFPTDNFPPEVLASRTYEHVIEWVGVRVKVITCNPNFPKGKFMMGTKIGC